jgi:hypothetical protein
LRGRERTGSPVNSASARTSSRSPSQSAAVGVSVIATVCPSSTSGWTRPVRRVSTPPALAATTPTLETPRQEVQAHLGAASSLCRRATKAASTTSCRPSGRRLDLARDRARVHHHERLADGRSKRPARLSPGAQAGSRDRTRGLDSARAAALVVSILSDAGVPLDAISQLVGHSGTTVTELVYRHQPRPVIQTGATVMDQLFKASDRSGSTGS